MKIEIIKCLEDNFSYLLINEKNSDFFANNFGEDKFLNIKFFNWARGVRPEPLGGKNDQVTVQVWFLQ